MKAVQLTIQGMTCGHCVTALKKELSKIDGLNINSAKIGSAEVTIDENKINNTTLQKAVEEAGYSIISIQ